MLNKQNIMNNLREQLISAFHIGDFDKVKKILNQGLSVNTIICWGDTLLHKTAYDNNRALAKWLLWKGADVNKEDVCGQTPLHCACSCGHKNIANLLMHFGAKVNSVDHSLNTPLHLACWGEYTEIVTGLLKRGAKVDEFDENGCTPLSVACQCNSINLINILLDSGASVNLKNAKGKTPLYFACKSYSKEPVKNLLSRGALISVKDLKGNTPLHSAATKNAEVIEVLLDHGADINCRNNSGKTPYDLCLESLEDGESWEMMMKTVFVKHIAKLKVAKLPVNIDISKELNTEEYQEMFAKSLEELKKISILEFSKDYSLIGVLKTKNKPYLISSEHFQSLEEFLCCDNLVEMLPIYGQLLRNIFTKSKLVTQAYQSLCCEKRKEWCRSLPSLVKENILDYLNTDDLENLINSN